MSCFSLYGINFYADALENLDRFIKKIRQKFGKKIQHFTDNEFARYVDGAANFFTHDKTRNIHIKLKGHAYGKFTRRK